MGAIPVVLFVFLVYITLCDGLEDEYNLEARGKKKKKIALFVFFADLIIKKIFILKLVYAFVFWVVLHKAGYFLTWFASYLKEQKKEHHHEYHDHHPHYGYEPYRKEGYGDRYSR